MKYFFSILILNLFLIGPSYVNAQFLPGQDSKADQWVDSVFSRLNKNEKIAQLMIIRSYGHNNEAEKKVVLSAIKKFNIGGICFFQGSPTNQALLTNTYQQKAKTPILICMDAEWGVGMRLDSVISFPRQMYLGAMPDAELVYKTGRLIGEQCRRLGVQVNYAPDIDVNNNPQNPVINDRSFGENKYTVAVYGEAMMRGMQDVGILACAKHFPGHGDVATDSHLDLPIILKTRQQLDSLELYPFRRLIKAGVGSIMIAHLYIPSIDSTPNLATSLSAKTVSGLLKEKLGYKGLIFTDALEMKGVSKFFPDGSAAVQSLKAGNDMLCLPMDIKQSIKAIKKAIRNKELKWSDIDDRVKKILLYKYKLGLNHFSPIDTSHLVKDLNDSILILKASLAKNAITIVKLDNPDFIPITAQHATAYVAIGVSSENTLGALLKKEIGTDNYYFKGPQDSSLKKETIEPQPGIIVHDSQSNMDSAIALLNSIKEKHYHSIIIGLHNYSRRPAHDFDLSASEIYLLRQLEKTANNITLVFGNPYAIMNSNPQISNLVACYEDDSITQKAAFEWLRGRMELKGSLPVSIPGEMYHEGTGVHFNSYFPMTTPEAVGMNTKKLEEIDRIANDAIQRNAMPGCVVLAARNGKVFYYKAFGYKDSSKREKTDKEMVYDLASLTKVSATTVSIMKLYDEGKIDLDATLGDYLPWTRGTDKAPLKIRDILMHQAGLVPFITFYKETLDPKTGEPLKSYYRETPDSLHQIRVADNLYLLTSYEDTIKKRILESPLGPRGKYVYSDNDFIFMGKIVEAITGENLDEYTRTTFYEPLRMTSTGFLPWKHMPLEKICPTEKETHFRNQLLWGDVHDEGAAMLGEIAGHAGLFSNAYDIAQLYQMLLNGGTMNGRSYIKKETIEKFTAYQDSSSRRGLGFDKPERKEIPGKEPYPAEGPSPLTFGHTGFTGTAIWVDPQYNLVYIFLSNRVNPTRNNETFLKLSVRPRIQEVLYSALQP